MRHHNIWLFKSEPDEFSVDDLARLPGRKTRWSGVRNYMARNLLRDQVKVGDTVLFYYSSTEPKGIAGICVVTEPAAPDKTAFDPKDPYHDPKSTAENPIWMAVEIQLVKKLSPLVTLSQLKRTPGLEDMMLLRKGSRLSIQPVTESEWKIISRLING